MTFPFFPSTSSFLLFLFTSLNHHQPFFPSHFSSNTPDRPPPLRSVIAYLASSCSRTLFSLENTCTRTRWESQRPWTRSLGCVPAVGGRAPGRQSTLVESVVTRPEARLRRYFWLCGISDTFLKHLENLSPLLPVLDCPVDSTRWVSFLST